MDSKADSPPQSGWASFNPLRTFIEGKVEEGGMCPLFPGSLLSWDIHLISCPALQKRWWQVTPLTSWVSSLQMVVTGLLLVCFNGDPQLTPAPDMHLMAAVNITFNGRQRR